MKKEVIKKVEVSKDVAKKHTYNNDFVSKMKRSEEDIKEGKVSKIEPEDVWKV